MSLYDDDLLEAKKDGNSKIGNWTDSIKLLQGPIHAKKFHQQQNRKDLTKNVVAPVADLRKKRPTTLSRHSNAEVTFNSMTGKMEKRDGNVTQQDFSGTSLIENITSNSSVFGFSDEYDPLKPNDYEKFKERKGNVFPPPISSIEEEKRSNFNIETENHLKEEFFDEQSFDEMEIETGGTNFSFRSTKGTSAVAKMMAKMGYREGQGLGKSQQGMSSALIVEKTSKRGGKILHEKEKVFLPTTQISNVVLKGDSGINVANELKNSSKVVLLKNMVGPGEVDDLLDSETKEECQKYGEVEKCLIYEIPEAPEDEAVRIFVEFKRVESAIKAVVDMNGRYFAGRVVKAKFYDFDKFRQFDLAEDF